MVILFFQYFGLCVDRIILQQHGNDVNQQFGRLW
jgi:hypothetical protein